MDLHGFVVLAKGIFIFLNAVCNKHAVCGILLAYCTVFFVNLKGLSVVFSTRIILNKKIDNDSVIRKSVQSGISHRDLKN